MLSFRKKITISHIFVFIILSLCVIPVVKSTAMLGMRKAMVHMTEGMIEKLQAEPNTQAMVQLMKTDPEFIFRPSSLLDAEGNTLYHNEIPDFTEEQIQTIQKNEPEVIQTVKYGYGFSKRMSPFFHKEFYFVGLRFAANGQAYILHVNFTINIIDQIIQWYDIAILILCVLFIATTTIANASIVHIILKPLKYIIDALKPYEQGKEEFLPEIALPEIEEKGEFGKLANIFNSLRLRIKREIEHLQAQKEETEEILESLGEGVVAVDLDANVVFINATACKMLEIEKREIIYSSLNQFSTELSREGHELIQHALKNSEPIIQTITIRDTAPLFYDLIAAPLAHKMGAILVIQDKTYAYRLLEVGKDFVANASHELRTPITIIRGFAETLQDIPDLSKEMLYEITEKIVRTCMRLDKLVRSLIILSDIEHIPPERLQSTDLILAAERCIDQLLALNPQVKANLKTDLEKALIIADVDLIEMAITNILENAVKYSQGNPEIEVRIEKQNREIQLSIQDNGIGISETDLPHIFDRFYTVDKARSRKAGGAGLGLSIVKNIIEKHKGKIFATSKLGKGTTFILIFPSSKKS
ncbi:MAG: PAS domain-containing protein [Parachlamydiales bacterium]|nr:PAS domain-containing protein [Parachlamydiales bacterium]